MPRSQRATDYYVHTLPGLEGIAWEEIRELVQPITPQGFKVVPNRNGLVLFSTPTDPSALLGLRTAEDLFHTVARVSDVPWGGEGLNYIYDNLAQSLSVNHGYNLLSNVRRLPTVPRTTFRVIVRIAGKNQPYRRSALAAVVSKAVRARTRRRWKQVTDGEQVELWANLLGRELVLGLRLSDETMRHRPYQEVHLPASLRPSVAAAMVRLSDPAPDDTFIDPMCGTGTLLIERDFVERHHLLLAGDIDTAAVRAAQQNIGPRHKPRDILLWDARHLPLPSESVDRVATNLPFGKQLSRPKDLPALYRGLVAEMSRVLRPNGRAVLLTSEINVLRSALQQEQGLISGKSYRISLLGHQATIQLVERVR